MTSKLKYLVASGVISAAMMSASSAFAAGTTQGTDIDNTVTVDFNVGGVAQTAETAADSFAVDRVVRFTVVEDTTGSRGGDTNVSPNEADAVTYFTVTNTSNDVLDIDLAATEASDANNILDPGLTYFVEDGTTPGYQVGEDTATFIDDLAEDGSVTVYVLGDIAATATNGQNADVTLTGTAHVGGAGGLGAIYAVGTNVVDDTTANTTGVETIFGDTGRDGVEADNDGYTVAAADLTVQKLSRVISDPVSTTNPKAIPGAVVEYCIVVSNGAGAATATGVTVSDDLDLITDDGLPTGNQIVTYDGSFTPLMNGTVVSGSTCTPGGDNGSYDAPSDVVSGTLNDIAAGETRTLVFRVTID